MKRIRINGTRFVFQRANERRDEFVAYIVSLYFPPEDPRAGGTFGRIARTSYSSPHQWRGRFHFDGQEWDDTGRTAREMIERAIAKTPIVQKDQRAG